MNESEKIRKDSMPDQVDNQGDRKDRRDNKKKSGHKNFKDKGFKYKKCRGRNDLTWYVKSEKMLNDAASISTYNPLGLKLKQVATFTGDSAPIAPITTEFTSPGMMCLHYAPVVGPTDSGAQAAINIAIQNGYSFTRSANSGAKVYERSDWGMYVFCGISAAVYLEEMKRLYRAMTTVSKRNRYLPRQLVSLLGGDYDDLEGNLADFRAYINTYAVRLSTLNIPSDIKLYDRWRFLVSNVFTDTPDIGKSQLYMFKPDYYYSWSEMDSTRGSAASMEESPFVVGSGRLTAFKAFGDMLLNNLLDSEDIGTISGDIMKAYSSTGLLHFDFIGQDEALEIFFNSDILTQIMNATFYGPIDNITEEDGLFTASVRQVNQNMTQIVRQVQYIGNPNDGSTQVGLEDSAYGIYVRRALSDGLINVKLPYYVVAPSAVLANFMTDSPVPGVVLEGTRLTTLGYAEANTAGNETSGKIIPYSYGTEIGTVIEIVTDYLGNNTHIITPSVLTMAVESDLMNWLGLGDYSMIASQVIAFDAHPTFYQAKGLAVNATDPEAGTLGTPYAIEIVPFFESQNVALLEKQVLDNCHDLAVCGLWNVPDLS